MSVSSARARAASLIIALVVPALLTLSCSSSGVDSDASGGDSGGVVVVLDVAPEPDAEAPPEICGSAEDCPTKAASRCVSPGRCRACADDSDCGVWQRCHLGACLARVCKPGEIRCDGDTEHTCDPDGKGWSAFICRTGTCSPAGCDACLPGQPMCVGDNVSKCNAEVTAFEAFGSCAATQHCADGACRDCLTPGEVSCSFGRAARCGAFGSWEIVDNCASKGQHCAGGKCIDCEPANLRCTGPDLVCLNGVKTTVIQACDDAGLMCWNAGCWPKCGDYDFKTQTEGQCDDGVCCQNPMGQLLLTGRSDCEPSGGEILPWHVCQTPVCCKLPDGSLQDLGEGKCRGVGGTSVGPDSCAAPVCCRGGDTQFTTSPVGACHAGGGKPVADVWCGAPTCCALAGVDFQASEPEACVGAGGVPVAGIFCAEGGLRTEPPKGPGTAGGTCDFVPFMVVPSSGSDALVVYDLDTLAVVTPAFPVCKDPSRVVMAADTRIFVACRGSGQVVHASRTGQVLWTTQLPDCKLSRGIALSPDGRLFGSCYQPGIIYELDPDTGEIARSSKPLSGPVYGLVADSHGLYAAGGGVRKISFDAAGPLEEVWNVQRATYGIASDGGSAIWVSGPSFAALDPADGTLLEEWTGASAGGITVTANGDVVGAAGNQLVIVRPGVGLIESIALPAGTVWAHGVSSDAKGNLYAIHVGSSNVTRVRPDRTMETFGGGGLVSPYSYNGDLTGFSVACLPGAKAGWGFEPLDVGVSVAWLTVSWEAQVPPGATLSVQWRVDGGPWTTQNHSGEIIAATGQVLELRGQTPTTPTGEHATFDSVTVRWAKLPPAP